jgi:hypothetical protein
MNLLLFQKKRLSKGIRLALDFMGGTLDSRISFSRGSNATVVGSNGLIQYAPHNLLTYSEQFDNVAWTKTNATVSVNVTTAPDGTTTADKLVENTVNAAHGVNIDVTASPTTKYTVSSYIKAGERTWARIALIDNLGIDGGRAWFDLVNGVVGNVDVQGAGSNITASIVAVGNGWYRCSVSGQMNNSKTTLTSQIRLARSNGDISYIGDGVSGIYIWGAQLNEGALQPYYSTTVKNLLGYSQNFENAAWTKSNSSVLYNLLTYSEQFDDATWFKRSGSTVNANTLIAPDGTLTADTQINTDTTTNGTYIRKNGAFAADNTVYCASCYFKQGSQPIASITMYSRLTSGSNLRVLYDLNAGTYTLSNIGSVSGGTAGMEYIGNGWWRAWASANMLTGSDTTGVQFTPSVWAIPSAIGSEYGYIWGAQVVASTSAENYTVTTSASAPIQAVGPFGFDGGEKLVEDSATNTHLTQQTPTFALGSVYTQSVYAKAGERTFLQLRSTSLATFSASFDLVNGTYSQVTTNTVAFINSIGNGWFRCSITFTAGATGASAARVAIMQNATTQSYTGDGTSGIYIFGAQLSDSASLDPYSYNPVAAPTSTAYYGPRFDYDPVTLAPKGLLIEEQRTNLLIRSIPDLAIPTGWSVGIGGGTFTHTLVTAPSQFLGFQSFILQDQVTSGRGYLTTSITLSASTTYTLTCYFDTTNTYVTSGSTTIVFIGGLTDATGTLSASVSSIDSTGKVSITFTTGTVIAAAIRVGIGTTNTAVGRASYSAWQLEVGTFPTSYIPTTSATVTRAADNASMVGSNFGSWYNQSEGTVFTKWDTAAFVQGAAIRFTLSDGTSSNQIRVRLAPSGSTQVRHDVVNAGVTSVLGSPATIDINSNREAIGFAANNYAGCLNAGNVVTSTSLTIPTAINQITIGSGVNAASPLNGHIQSIKYYPTRLPNGTLQRLTR